MNWRGGSTPFWFLIVVSAVSAISGGPGIGGDGVPGPGFPRPQTPAPVGEAAPAAGVKTRVVPASAAEFEKQPFSFSAPAETRDRQSRNRPAGYSLPSILPVLFYLTLLCAIFVGILCLAKKYLPGHRQLFSHPALEILGRTHLDHRRYVSLLRVGKRVLVLGVSPDEINTLSEITEEEELLGILEVARPKSETGKNLFGRLFRQKILETEAGENLAAGEIKAREIGEQAAGLRRKMAAGIGDPSPGPMPERILRPELPAKRRKNLLDAIG
ncbi:MAG: flagellar biosynthetic protein FliO [Planctomycetota bacterium]|jgi:flagellar protein FliO/FliZ|nr:flagellar biosynthetic protein FliO [Planctomycetota bacterium]MDR1520148.1 flagellar biosynthetic protein FliO [Planctomycetota bacterium]